MARRSGLALVLLAGCLLVAACDAVRYPGDGGEAPRTPAGEDENGLPGPPPPLTPVSDPYGEGADGDPGDGPDAGPGNGQGEADGDNLDGPSPDPDDAGDGGLIDDAADDGAGEADGPVGDISDGTGDGADPDAGDGLASDNGDDSGLDGDGGAADTNASAGTDGGLTDDNAGDPPLPPVFSYFGPGQLLPGSGTGAFEQIVHAPDMVFPIRSAPAFLQSQVWSFGGGVAGGDQCDSRNYAYPWRDNFCEMRTADRGTPFCPLNRVHQGQDIRVGTPEDCRQLRASDAAGRTLHEVVAVEDGVIYDIGTYTVKLRSGGRVYRYMHLNMSELQVEEGDTVEAGDILGYVSNDFGGTPTTFHLHFEIIQNTEAYGWEHVPPYLSLVEAYERREAGRGEQLPADFAAASTRVLPIPEGLEIIE